MNVDNWNNHTETWKRRQNLCIGYQVTYNHDTQTHIVDVFGVQNNHTPAPLGQLRMKNAEWTVFHQTVYKNWEDIRYPVPDDTEPDIEL